MKEITRERLEKEFARTGQALKVIKLVSGSKDAADLLDLAKRYYEDAKYFQTKGDFASAFGALNYAFGLLDAGAKLKLFDVSADKDLFIAD